LPGKKQKREDILAKIQRIGKENVDENEIILSTSIDKPHRLTQDKLKEKEKDKDNKNMDKSPSSRHNQAKYKEEIDKLNNEVHNLKKRVNQEKLYVRDLK
jgi:hypothetical protein